MKINWTVRLRNPIFYLQVGGALLLTALGYSSMEPTQLTSWSALGEVLAAIVKNPYLLFLCLWSAWNAINDPTVSGVGDSERALTYEEPAQHS